MAKSKFSFLFITFKVDSFFNWVWTECGPAVAFSFESSPSLSPSLSFSFTHVFAPLQPLSTVRTVLAICLERMRGGGKVAVSIKGSFYNLLSFLFLEICLAPQTQHRERDKTSEWGRKSERVRARQRERGRQSEIVWVMFHFRDPIWCLSLFFLRWLLPLAWQQKKKPHTFNINFCSLFVFVFWLSLHKHVIFVNIVRKIRCKYSYSRG